MSSPQITIATRESRLALWQAEHVQSLLRARGHAVALLGMTTRGDQILDRTLSKVGGKGLFVKELETALEEGRADIAVHSLKDVPMELPAGFELACVMAREDPRDAWVSAGCATLADLPPGAVIGTSSLRRTVLLRAATVIMRMSMDLNGITGAKPMNTPTAVPRASEAGEPCSCLNFFRIETIVARMAVNGRDG